MVKVVLGTIHAIMEAVVVELSVRCLTKAIILGNCSDVLVSVRAL